MKAALQIAYLILGVRALGLDAGPMVGSDPEAVEAEFALDGRYRVQDVFTVL